MTSNVVPADDDLVERGFVPCPMCRQYSHSIGEGQLTEAFNHFQTMIAHPIRGHPMCDAFDEKTQDAAQVLMAAASGCRNALEEARARSRALHAALTPSAETKAAYIGEFSFTIDEVSGDVGCEVARKVDVPWTTVKEIMAAIIGHAALNPIGERE